MSAVDPQLVLSTVQSGYGQVKVVNNVSLEVATGEIVAVIGRNGVGKTTLMKTIIGEIPLMAGAIRFRGVDVNGLNSTRRSRLGVGYVPQGRDVFARMTVAENLALGVPRWRSEQGELRARVRLLSGPRKASLAARRLDEWRRATTTRNWPYPGRPARHHPARRTFGRRTAQYRAGYWPHYPQASRG